MKYNGTIFQYSELHHLRFEGSTYIDGRKAGLHISTFF